MEGALPELWKLIVQNGPVAALLLYACYKLNKEREQYRDERAAILERTLKAINDAETAVREVTTIVQAKVIGHVVGKD